MADPDRLSPSVLSLVHREAGEIGFSSVSGWEIAIKSALGKVTGIPIGDIEAEIEALGWSELKFSHAVAALPFHHHDPFDRAFTTNERIAAWYPVKVLW